MRVSNQKGKIANKMFEEMSMSLRNNITPSLDVAPSIQTTAKKSYKKPSLSGFGKVSSVTASGSGKLTEPGIQMNPIKMP